MSEASTRSRTQDQWPLGLLQAVLALFAFYRGFRAPSLWSLNYYQLSWADGFARRGLLGTLLLPLGCARFEPHLIWAIQYAVLAATLILLLYFCRRGAAAWAFCLFFVSDAGAFFFNEVGYPEQLLALLAVACGFLLRRGRAPAAALLLAAAVLVHEMAVFTVLPLVLVLWLGLPEGRRPPWWRLCAPMALALAVLAACSGPLTVATLQRYAGLAAACGHPLGRPDFLGFYQHTLRGSLRPYYNVWEVCLQILPLALALAWWTFGERGRLRSVRAWAFFAACLCPLALGFLGWDTGRWIFLALLQTLLLLGLGGEASDAWTRGFIRALPLAVLVLLLRIPLFDGFTPRPLDLQGLLGFRSALVEQLSAAPTK